MEEQKKRIDMLDGFRCIAIIMVLLYHFYSRWTLPRSPVNYYPYGNALSGYFKYGFLGVNFFFIISGFVIFYTLEKSRSYGNFLTKRFIRLLPPMVLCSLITYFFVKLADPEGKFPEFQNHTALDFFPSLTFTHPIFWIKLFRRDDIYYINGSYWSLWVEVGFYVLSGAIFFLNKEKFIANWFKLLLPAAVLKMIRLPEFNFILKIPHAGPLLDALRKFDIYLNFFNYVIYFSLGILFYCLFFKKKLTNLSKIICSIFTGVELYFLQDNGARLLVLLMILIFAIFVYYPGYLSFLKTKVITRIGIISYTIYLIHENVGVILINKLSLLTNSVLLTRLIPLLVIVIIVIFAELAYRVYEKPVTDKLHRLLKPRLHTQATKANIQ